MEELSNYTVHKIWMNANILNKNYTIVYWLYYKYELSTFFK